MDRVGRQAESYLQIFDSVCRIVVESLSNKNFDVEVFSLLFQIVHSGREDLFGVLQRGNLLPPVFLAQLETGRIVENGGRVGAKERLEASSIREGRRTGAERDDGQVPEVGRLGNGRRDITATWAKQHDDIVPVVVFLVDHFVQIADPFTRITLR